MSTAELVESPPVLHTHKEDSTEPTVTWYKHFISGEVAGMVGCFFAHPMDTLKCKKQMLTNLKTNQSTFNFMREIVKSEGVLSLYRGLFFPFVGFGVLFSIAFGVNGVCQDYFLYRHRMNNNLLTDSSQLALYELMIGGSLAGFASSFFRTPIERIKVWSQIHKTSTFKSTSTLLSRYGFFGGLMNGLNATIAREVPQFAVYYPIYEFTCKLLAPDLTNKSEVNSFWIFISGGSAGVGCWIVTYPIDVIKTKWQASKPGTYKSMISCGIGMYKETRSFRSFFVGLAPTIYRAAILHSAIFLVYERVLESLHSF